MRKRNKKKPTKKKPVKRNRRRYRRKIHISTIFHRVHGLGVDERDDWDWDATRTRMRCISCYGEYYIWNYDRFKVAHWFCEDCREKVTKRKWALIGKFHKYMEAARFRKNNPTNLDHGDVLAFTNSIYRCVRGKASRDTVIKTMKLGVDLSQFADPIILGGLLDKYDKIVGIQAKQRK